MKHILFFLFIFISLSVFSQDIDSNEYFINKTLRFDYIHAGNSDTAIVFQKKIKQEPYWGGSHKKLIDPFYYGHYRVLVYDKATNILIYSRGYATLFQEWQATDEAKTSQRSFYESVIVPFPKNTIEIVIEERNRRNVFFEIYRKEIEPSNIFIQKGLRYDFETYTMIDNGKSENKVDIVFLAEGYQENEIKKFKNDAQQMTDALFAYEPFKSHKDDFNIHLVLSYSKESGTDIPGGDIWKNTILNSNFYTFGSERYLTTQDFEAVRDLAALVPYDQIYILVNTAKYGGGGIFNFYSLCVSDNVAAKQVFVHEFGHGFGGLADEYWTSDVAVEDYFPSDIEPIAPNLTTLINFENKWKDLIDKNTPVPTPAIEKYLEIIGVFEGGGYVEKGVYRPQQNCMMRALAYPFCGVCQKTIEKMILLYTD